MTNTTVQKVLDFMQLTSGATDIPSDTVILTFIGYADRSVDKNLESTNATDKELVSNIMASYYVAKAIANKNSNIKSFRIGKVAITHTTDVGWAKTANGYKDMFYETLIDLDVDVDLFEITEPSDYKEETYAPENVEGKHYPVTGSEAETVEGAPTTERQYTYGY